MQAPCRRRDPSDICSNGGILETKKMGDMAQKYNTALAMHMRNAGGGAGYDPRGRGDGELLCHGVQRAG